MKKYLYDYIKEIEELLNSKTKITDKIIEEHLIKIQFFQHERLIHLIVTLFYSFVFLVFIAACIIYPIFLIIVLILTIFLIFYVIHYFKLENGIQYLYRQYDMLRSKK